MHVNRTSISTDAPEVVLESLFNSYDVDHSGQLEEDEFNKLLDRLGIDESDKEIIMQLVDSDNNHVVDYDEFRNMVRKIGVEKIIMNKNKEFELLKYTYETFKQYDADGNGTISWQEFYAHLTKHGFTHEQISTYWNVMDMNHDFAISFEEFWRGFAPQVQQMFIQPKSNNNEIKEEKENGKNEQKKVINNEPKKDIKKDEQKNEIKKDGQKNEIKKDEQKKDIIKKDEQKKDIKKGEQKKDIKKDDQKKDVKKDVEQKKNSKKEDEQKNVKKEDQQKSVKNIDKKNEEKIVTKSAQNNKKNIKLPPLNDEKEKR